MTLFRIAAIAALAVCARAATYYMLIGDGQSLSNGAYGCQAISTMQPYSNQMWNGSALVALTETKACQGITNAYSSSVTYNPYADVTQSGMEYMANTTTTGNAPPGSQWVATSVQETPMSSALNNTTMLQSGFSAIGNNFGQNGTPITTWGNQSAINNIVSTVNAVKSAISPNNLVVIGVMATGGESDYDNQGAATSLTSCSMAAGTTAYYANSICFQQTLQAAIQTATGQSQPVPVIYSQFSDGMFYNTYSQTCPDGGAQNCIDTYPVSGTANHVPIAQYQLARDSANAAICGTAGYPACNSFFLTGPKYAIDAGTSPALHRSAFGYNMIGAETARTLSCLYSHSFSATNAQCPSTIMPALPISVSGTTVTINVTTPAGLSLDTVADAYSSTWSNGAIPYPYYNGSSHTSNAGFQFFTSNGEIQVTNVSISGTTVTLTLASVPTGSNWQVAYGFEGTHYAQAGPFGCAGSATTCNGQTLNGSIRTDGTPHGNIRTVADYTDLNGNMVYHWMPAFIENAQPAPGPAIRSGGICSGCTF